MSEKREIEIETYLESNKHTPMAVQLVELLRLRREKYRDKLENTEDGVVRGRAKECKDLLHILLTDSV